MQGGQEKMGKFADINPKETGHKEETREIVPSLEELVAATERRLREIKSAKEHPSEAAVEPETPFEKRTDEETPVLRQEASNLEIAENKIIKEQLLRLRKLKKEGRITEENYAKTRFELSKSRRFKHLVRMEQAIRDAEAFILENPDSSKKEILLAIQENPERKTKLSAVQKEILENAVDSYINARKKLLDYLNSLPVGLGKFKFDNPLDILEHNPVAKKTLLEDLGLAKEFGIKTEDVIIQTDFPAAIGLEFKDPGKMFAIINRKTGGELEGGPENYRGVFLREQFSKKHTGMKAEKVRALDYAVYFINGGAAAQVKRTKTHELQHHIFNKFLKPEKDSLKDFTKIDLKKNLIEDTALDELTAFLKTDVYEYSTGHIFVTQQKNFKQLPISDPIVQSFFKIKNQFRRLESAGIDAKDIYATAETSENLAELAERLSLIPCANPDSGRLTEMLKKEREEVSLETAAWILDEAEKGKKIKFADPLIEAMGEVLLRAYGGHKETVALEELDALKTMAKRFEKITGKKYKYFNLAIESFHARLQK